MVFDQRGQHVGEQCNVSQGESTPRQVLGLVLPLLKAYRRLAAETYEIPTVRAAKLREADAVITTVEGMLDGV